MKKKFLAILLGLISCLFVGCTKDFEYSSDKFYLKEISTGGQNSAWYSFYKKIDKDMIMVPLSENETNGYELEGQFHIMGFWGSIGIFNKEQDPYICAAFCCYYKAGMGDTKLNIYFNYTVASTGERVEEVWEVDFGQKPYKDDREK